EYGKKKKFDGIICGHIHHAQNENYDGVNYLNCGDWVESCTALVENFDGTFEIIYWDKLREEFLISRNNSDKEVIETPGLKKAS
ncbi:UDP-2,3-diacylglucosamine diphosphatase, partial [Pelagibacterales bacterium SAG-MED16]|nr:UDP-2,3-diacylglucosamine diphosphatase [Pelagibacterales bacterium SAG-MED16]